MLAMLDNGKLDMNAYERLCEKYLSILYQNGADTQAHRSGSQITETLGEILSPSVNKLFSLMPLTSDDVFVDLGSGLGKIVIQAFLQSDVREAIGIEIVPWMHECATKAASRLQQHMPELFANRKLTFLSGDFLSTSFNAATVALINATCFGPELLHALGRIIEQTPSIHTVFSMRPIPDLQRLHFRRAVSVECSWDAALCYMYQC